MIELDLLSILSYKPPPQYIYKLCTPLTGLYIYILNEHIISKEEICHVKNVVYTLHCTPLSYATN